MAGKRVPARTEIVDAAEILNQVQIRSENLAYLDFSFKDDLDCVQWLARRGLLHNSLLCQKCQDVQMSFIRRVQRGDGYTWKCKECYATASVRKGSFFSRSKLPLHQILCIIYGWSRNYLQKDIAHEARLGKVSNHTIVDWCSVCREVCEEDLIDHPAIIGGLEDDLTAKVVEINESKFFHKRHHRGQWRQGHWVLGGVERGTGRCFLVEVPDRSADTLCAIIQRFILPGTIIFSDGWKAYDGLGQLEGGIYEHQVADDDLVHKQNVHNIWMHTKRKLRHQFGTSEALFTSHLHEFVWRNRFRNSNCFGEFVICLQGQYPV